MTDMPSKEAKLRAQIEQLEAAARAHPTVYRLRVCLIALLGYAYILVVLTALALGSVVCFLLIDLETGSPLAAAPIVLGLLLGALFMLMLTALRVPPPHIGGLPLSPEQAPGLFRFVEEVRRGIRGPTIQEFRLSYDATLSVSQASRLGPFGWPRNHLVVGLPLLFCLTQEEFRAAVLHEFGHLSGAQGRLGPWLARVRMTWAALLSEGADAGPWGHAAFRWMFRWYLPILDRHIHSLRRLWEADADRLAASVAGPETLARALLKLESTWASVEVDFVEGLRRQAAYLPEPPEKAFADLLRATREVASGPPRLWRAYRKLLSTTRAWDSHPALSDRIRALGLHPTEFALRDMPPTGPSAAETLFGGDLARTTNEVGRHWWRDVAPVWRVAHESAREAANRLADLGERAAKGGLLAAECLERARLVAELRPPTEAAPVLRECHVACPRHPEVAFLLGHALSETDGEACVEPFRVALRGGPEIALQAAEALTHHHARVHRMDLATHFAQEAETRLDTAIEDAEERSEIGDERLLQPHGLDAAEIARLEVHLPPTQLIQEAYLVRKAMTVDLAETLHVLILVPAAGTVLVERTATRWEQLLHANALRRVFPHDLLVVFTTRGHRRLLRTVRRIDRAWISRR